MLKLIEGQTREKLLGEIQKFQCESASPELRIKKETEFKNTESKIANLTKRISELPDGVPANSFYDEIKLLIESNTRLVSEVSNLNQSNSKQALITAAALENALNRLKSSLSENPEVGHDQRRRIVQALIHQIRVTSDGYELHFYAGTEQIKKT